MIAQRVVDCGFQDQVFTIYDVLHGDFSTDTGVIWLSVLLCSQVSQLSIYRAA